MNCNISNFCLRKLNIKLRRQAIYQLLCHAIFIRALNSLKRVFLSYNIALLLNAINCNHNMNDKISNCKIIQADIMMFNTLNYQLSYISNKFIIFHRGVTTTRICFVCYHTCQAESLIKFSTFNLNSIMRFTHYAQVKSGEKLFSLF